MFIEDTGGVADNSVQERAEPNLTAMMILQLTESLFDSIVLVRVVGRRYCSREPLCMVHVTFMKRYEYYVFPYQ